VLSIPAPTKQHFLWERYARSHCNAVPIGTHTGGQVSRGSTHPTKIAAHKLVALIGYLP